MNELKASAKIERPEVREHPKPFARWEFFGAEAPSPIVEPEPEQPKAISAPDYPHLAHDNLLSADRLAALGIQNQKRLFIKGEP